ncbi:MAG: nucleotidyltransferase domain-containing protein [Leptospiraceae bacterium]|nr:nucleotidyltransferase domain-containing protein [Leptospiraceae bacterium]
MTVADQTIIEQESIQKLITILVTKIDPDKIILFGSRTTKDFHADSDYDLCIIKKDGCIEDSWHKRFTNCYMVQDLVWM